MLRRALDTAKLGDPEKLESFARLDRFVRNIECRYAPEADFDAIIAHEHSISASLEGRTVFDDREPAKHPRSLQLPLFP